jgi:hypothetical protein
MKIMVHLGYLSSFCTKGARLDGGDGWTRIKNNIK